MYSRARVEKVSRNGRLSAMQDEGRGLHARFERYRTGRCRDYAVRLQIEISGKSEGQISRAFAGEAADRGMQPWRVCLLNRPPPLHRIVKLFYYFSIFIKSRGDHSPHFVNNITRAFVTTNPSPLQRDLTYSSLIPGWKNSCIISPPLSIL